MWYSTNVGRLIKLKLKCNGITKKKVGTYTAISTYGFNGHGACTGDGKALAVAKIAADGGQVAHGDVELLGGKRRPGQ